jgi:outer membrane lipase/esterase
MRFSTTVGLTALAAVLWGAATAASAQSYQRIVVFGDSLSDNGNIPLLAGPGYPPPPYYANHFSNGPTYIEDLAAELGQSLGHIGQTTGSADWAVGGAETGTGNYFNPALPGMAQEIGGYFASGGTFGPHDMVMMWGGANDIFAGVLPAAASANPTGYITNVGVNAAGNIVGYAAAMAHVGAGTVVVPNLPPLAQTPQFNSGPDAAAAPIALTGANAFNSALLAGLQADAKANPHTNFILLDANSSTEVLIASGQKFGLTNTTQACISVLTCVAGSAASQNSYLFWDGVHPTAQTHAILAAILTDYVTYGDRGAAVGAETETALRRRTQTFDTAIDRLQGRDFGADKSGLGVSLEYDSAQVDARTYVDTTRDASETLRVSLDGVISPTLKVGGLFSVSNADIDAGALKFRDQTAAGDALMGWRNGNLFVNADAGVGLDDISNISRQTALPGLANTGSTSGWSAGVKVQTGAWFDLANHWTVSPRAALSFARGSLNGYTESGPFDRYAYDSNAIDATALEGTLRLSGPIAPAVWTHLEGGYRDYISYNGGVGTTLADNVAQTLNRKIGEPDGGLALIDAGLNGVFLQRFKWDLAYRGRFGSRYDDNLAHAGLNMAF